MRKSSKLIVYVCLIGLVFGIDWVSKCLAQHYLVYQEPVAIFPGFNLYLNFNTGAAFSFFNQGGLQLLLLILIAGFLILFLGWRLYKIAEQSKWDCVALSMIIGGALGNVLDRFLYGHVIDFLDFYIKTYHWPTFNVADTFICTGVIMLVINVLRKKSCAF